MCRKMMHARQMAPISTRPVPRALVQSAVTQDDAWPTTNRIMSTCPVPRASSAHEPTVLTQDDAQPTTNRIISTCPVPMSALCHERALHQKFTTSYLSNSEPMPDVVGMKITTAHRSNSEFMPVLLPVLLPALLNDGSAAVRKLPVRTDRDGAAIHE